MKQLLLIILMIGLVSGCTAEVREGVSKDLKVGASVVSDLVPAPWGQIAALAMSGVSALLAGAGTHQLVKHVVPRTRALPNPSASPSIISATPPGPPPSVVETSTKIG